MSPGERTAKLAEINKLWKKSAVCPGCAGEGCPSCDGTGIRITRYALVTRPPEPRSILWCIEHAQTERELQVGLMSALTKTQASKKTKKRWRAAAERRLGELRAQQIVRI